MEALRVELSQYETQLSQIQMAISASADGPERDNLITLEKDIIELIKLTKDSLQPDEQEPKSDPDPLADEYKLFQAELEVVGSLKNDEERSSGVDSTKSLDEHGLHSDLKAMEGMKCQAPYKYAWTEDVTYHNALIFCIEDLDNVTSSDEIQVKVMFTNPTHKEMLPCPYYLDGECRFNDEKCRFSHGERVFLNSLRDYREPDFGILTEGKTVLAKKDDGLWHRAVIKSIDGVKAIVKFDSNIEEETHFQNILPLEGPDGSDESDSDSENGTFDDTVDTVNNEEIFRRILMAPPSSALGDWERFTKGFGSKIMAKMGYIHGSGLGREGKGRVEPVSAVILPAGKSLDHCMMLREHSGGDKDFFKAEKRMKQIQKKQEKMLQKSYEREKNRSDVFMFLNRSLGQSNKNEIKAEKNTQKQLQSESTRNLNVTSLQLAEEVRKVEREVKSLKNSLARYSNQSKEFTVLKGKLDDRQTKLSQLKASEQRIANEQERRRDRKKLTVF